MPIKRKCLLLLCLLLFWGSGCSGSAQFSVSGDEATMTGYIDSNTPGEVESLLKSYPKLKKIIMDNVPGSLDDEANRKAARMIRKHGLHTHVPKEGFISAGGVDFFIAGVKRTVDVGGKLGVHAWSDASGKSARDYPIDSSAHDKYINYYKEMGLGLQAQLYYYFTIRAAPPERVYILDRKQLLKYTLITD